MNNYSREKAVFDFFRNANQDGAREGIVLSRSNEEKGNKEQQRAEESPILLIVLVLAVAL